MKGTVNIEGSPNLVRDMDSHAIINKDTSAYKQHMAAKAKKQKEAARVDKLAADVAHLKSSVDEILSILKGK
jgi:hypothetical protein